MSDGMANHIPRMPPKLTCSLCHYIATDNSTYAMHVLGRHKNEGNYFVRCMHPACKYKTNVWHNFNQHTRRKHGEKSFCYTVASTTGELRVVLDVVPVEDIQPVLEPLGETNHLAPFKTPLAASKFMLHMESKHHLTREGSQDVTNTLSHLVTNILETVETKFREFVQDESKTSQEALAKAIEYARPTDWEELSSEHKRRKLYERRFNYIPPQSIYLGKTLTRVRGSLKRLVQSKYGYIVPLSKLLQFLLHIPDVWKFVNSNHCARGVMGDFVDGEYMKNHPLTATGLPFISLLLSYDDVEIQNPLRSNKLHKLAMFYVTLVNIPPQYRSKLRSIFPIAIARSIDLKKFGLELLLSDFIRTVKQLQQGLPLTINGCDVTIHSDLIAALCDTPAAAAIGGFKESSSFAWKNCRMCNADKDTAKTFFSQAQFILRDMPTYSEQCKILEDENLIRNRVHWSQHFGVNKRSVLNGIEGFPVTANIIQDPMHVILEGVFPYVSALMLQKFIYVDKYFTLETLNTSIQNFDYSYLDTKNCPPIIDKQHIVKNKHLKMKAASALTMVYILPFIISGLIPSGNEYYEHFIKLVRISMLTFSPFCDVTTAGVLEVLIESFCTKFLTLYNEESITPKFHFLIHLPDQIVKFGPLKHQTTLRFEAKHGFFKDHRWRNFNNLPLSLLTKHQLQLCNITSNESGGFIEHFLEMEDKFKMLGNRTVGKSLSEILPNEEMMYTEAGSVTHKGREFRKGSAILIRDEDNTDPEFVIVLGLFLTDMKNIVVIVEECNILSFCFEMNAFEIEKNGVKKCSELVKMTWPLPLPVYSIHGVDYITNRFSAFNPFL